MNYVELIKENNISVQQNLHIKFYRTIMTIRNNVNSCGFVIEVEIGTTIKFFIMIV